MLSVRGAMAASTPGLRGVVVRLLLVLIPSARAASSRAGTHEHCVEVWDLGSDSWALASLNGSIRLPIATIPGSIQAALIAGGIIGDPLFRDNELQQRWVGQTDWVLSKSFDMPPAALQHAGVWLVPEGLDTWVDVELNQQTVLQARNFHRQYMVDVGHIVGQFQHLRLIIWSAATVAYKAHAAYPYPMPSNPTPLAYQHYNFIRKPASDLGWDWGPAVVPAGVHGPLRLLAHSVPLLLGVHTQQSHTAEGVRLDLECEMWAPPSQTAPARVTVVAHVLELKGCNGTTGEQLLPGGGPTFLKIQLLLPRASIQLWWPRGLGPQPLYTLRVEAQAKVPQTHAAAQPPLKPSGTGRSKLTAQPEAVQSETKLQGSAAIEPLETAHCRVALGGCPCLADPANCLAVRAAHVHPQSGCSSVQQRLGLRVVELVTQPLIAGVQPAEVWGEAGATGVSHSIGAPARSNSSISDSHMQPTRNSSARTASSGLQSRNRSDNSNGSSGRHVGIAQRSAAEAMDRLAASHLTIAPAIASAAGGDVAGETFYFRVNGKPVYIQGANMIPLDVLHERAGPTALRRLLHQAVAAHMNMVRVWGGGRYQLDEMYSWCDEHGLLVWQELMYACAPYPVTPELVLEGVLEARQQVRRLAYHASIVVWGGNNEVEASLDWYPETTRDPARYQRDFTTLFVDALREVVLQLDPGRPYLDSSPSNGVAHTEPYTKRWGNTSDPRFGDVHYYDYSADCLDPSSYPRAKFVSEHGVQSAASWHAIRRVTTQADWDMNSPGARFRQRHPDGDAQLQASLARHFKLPAAWSSPGDAGRQVALYQAWIYLTQVQHALCYATALRTWRSLAAAPDALTMGVLYWQLNDIWPGYSWSSTDYMGHTDPCPEHPTARAPHHSAAITTDRMHGTVVAMNVSARTANRRHLQQAAWRSATATQQQVEHALAMVHSLRPPGADAGQGGTRWRAAHYAVRQAFAPVTVLTHLGAVPGQLQVNLSSSVAVPARAVLRVSVVPLAAIPGSCGTVLGTVELWLAATQTQQAGTWDVGEALPRVNCTQATCFISLELTYWLCPPPQPAADLLGDVGLPAGQGHPASHEPQSAEPRLSGTRPEAQDPEEPSAARSAWWQQLLDEGERMAGAQQWAQDAASFPPANETSSHAGLADALNGSGDCPGTGSVLSGPSPAGPARVEEHASSAGCAASHGPVSSYSQVWLKAFKHLALVPASPSAIVFAAWRKVSARTVCFSAAASSDAGVVPLVVLDTPLSGHFSDNVLTLTPCTPRQLCFTWDPPAHSTGTAGAHTSSCPESQDPDILEALRSSLTWLAYPLSMAPHR